MSSEPQNVKGLSPIVKKRKVSEEKGVEEKGFKGTDVSLLWTVEVHRLISDENTFCGVEVFDSKEQAEFYLSQTVCDDMEFVIEKSAPVEIRGNLSAVKAFLEQEKAAGTKNINDLIYTVERSFIQSTVVNHANLKYTEPEPERTFGFDDFAMGLKEIAHEMDLYSAQLGHPDQEESTADMKTAMAGHIETLEAMLTYQQYLTKIGMCEEMSFFEVERALRMAKSLMRDIEKAQRNVNIYYYSGGKHSCKLWALLTSVKMYYADRQTMYQRILYLLWKVYNRYHDGGDATLPKSGALKSALDALRFDNSVPLIVREILSYKNVTAERLEQAMDECILYADDKTINGA
jgi:hypothetical protein